MEWLSIDLIITPTPHLFKPYSIVQNVLYIFVSETNKYYKQFLHLNVLVSLPLARQNGIISTYFMISGLNAEKDDIISSYIFQDDHRTGKTGKTGKMVKKIPCREKSGN